MSVLLSCILTACSNSNTSEKNSSKQDSIISPVNSNIHVEIIKPEALKLLDSNSKPEIIASGFTWTEGPLYVPDGDYLLFSDIPNNKVYKWKRNGDTATFLQPSGFTGTVYHGKEPGSNGLLFNKQHELVLMQHGDRRISKLNAPLQQPRPDFIPLVTNYEGKKLNSPNDGVMAADGSIYFTDPPYGLANGINDTAKQLSFQGVYLLKPDGELKLFTDELKFPNGIALSPDGKYLYVSNSDPVNKIWMQYELDENGMKKSGKIFYRAKEDEGIADGNPDGMKINKEGYIFAAGPQGILIFNPTGELIARIYTGRLTANCAFGKDQKELFITCSKDVMLINLH